MDTLTHAMLGALVVRATLPAKGLPGGIDIATLSLVGGLAAAFPDIDYLGFLLAPLTFLVEWHRGPTHSLLLAPVWGLLLGVLFAFLFRQITHWGVFVGVCMLALVSHIASDLITVYGTRILSPVSDLRVAFGTTFVIDAVFTLIVIAAFAISLRWCSRKAARAGLLVLVAYLGFQFVLKQQARELGEVYAGTHGLDQASVYALPQPLSPFNWMVVVAEAHRYHVTRVNMAYIDDSMELAGRLGWVGQLWSAYGLRNAPVWQVSNHFGDDPDRRDLAEDVWNHPLFSGFRRFAKFPVLYRIDTGDVTCVWYTDLRYVLPGLMPPFRYGMCDRGTPGTWALYRLRWYSHDTRQLLETG